MAISIVQTSTKQLLDNVTGVVTYNFGSALTPGNRVIVPMVSWPSSPTAGSSGGAGNANTKKIEQAAGDSVKFAVWESAVIGASPTTAISFTYPSSSYHLYAAIEVSGLLTGTTSYDTGAGATGTSNAPAVTSPTLAQANNLIVAIGGHDDGTNTVITPPGSPWTTVFNESDGTAHESGAGVWRTVSATTAVTATFSLPASRRWCAVIAAFKEASGGSSTPMTISGGQTQTPSGLRALAKVAIAVTAVQVLNRLRALTKITIALTAVQTLVYLRSVGLVRAGGQQQTTGSAPVISGIGQTILITTTQTPGVRRGLARTLLYTATQTPAAVRALARTLLVVAVQTAAAVLGQAYFKALEATSTQTPAFSRGVGRTRSTDQTHAPTLGQRLLARTLLYSATQTTAAARALARVFGVTITQTPAIAYDAGSGAHNMTISAAVTQTVSVLRGLSRALATSSTATPALTRALTRTAVAATHTQTPSTAYGRAYFRTIAGAVLQTPARALSAGVVRAVTALQTLASTRGLGVARAVVSTLVPARARQLLRTWIAGQSQTPTELHGQLHTFTAIAEQTQTPSYTYEQGSANALPDGTIVDGVWEESQTPEGTWERQ